MFKKLLLTSVIFSTLFTVLPVRAEDSIPPIQRLGTGIPTSIAASPDGTTLAVGSSIGVWLLDADTMQPYEFIDTLLWVDAVEYSVDGQYLRITARLYDTNSGVYDVRNVSVIWLFDAGQYRLWDGSGSIERKLKQVDLVYRFVDSTLGTMSNQFAQHIAWLDHHCSVNRDLCSRVGKGNFQVVDQSTTIVTNYFRQKNSKDTTLSPDGKILFGLSADGVTSWDLTTNLILRDLKSFFTGTLVQALWSSDSTKISSDAAVWDITTAQLVGLRQCSWGKTYNCNHPRMAAYHSVYYIDLLTGNALRKFEPHRAYLAAAKLSNDGAFLATSGDDGYCTGAPYYGCAGYESFARIWDFDSFTLLAEIPARFIDVEFSHDNRLIIGRTLSGLEVWDWQSGNNLWTTNTDGKCMYWSTLRYGRFHEYERNRAEANCLAIDPSGRYVATFANFSESTALYLWDLETGKLVFILNGHTSEITSAAFSPDGTKIAASSLDGTILIWPVP